MSIWVQHHGFLEAAFLAKGKLSTGDFSLVLRNAPLGSGALVLCFQQTPCVRSSQVPPEAVQALEQGRAKAIKTLPRSWQILAVSLTPLTPQHRTPQAAGIVCSPMLGAWELSTSKLGLGKTNAKG